MAGRYNNSYSGYMNPGLAEGFSNLSRAIFGSATDDNVAAAANANRERARQNAALAAKQEYYNANMPLAQSALAQILAGGGAVPRVPEYTETVSPEALAIAAENPELEGLAAPDRVYNSNAGQIDPQFASNLAAFFMNPDINQDSAMKGMSRGFAMNQAAQDPTNMRGWQAALGLMPGPDVAYTDQQAAAIRAEKEAGLDRRKLMEQNGGKPVIVGQGQTAYLPQNLQGQYGGATSLQGAGKPINVGEGDTAYLPGKDGTYSKDNKLEGRPKPGTGKNGGFSVKPADWAKINEQMETVLFDLEDQLNAGESEGYEYTIPAPLKKAIMAEAERQFMEAEGQVNPSTAALNAISMFYGDDIIKDGDFNFIGANDPRIVVPGKLVSDAREALRNAPQGQSEQIRQKIIERVAALGVNREAFIEALNAGN